MKRYWKAAVPATALATLMNAGHVTAATETAPAAAETSGDLDEVIVTGTRQTGLRAADSPAPIQILSAEAIKAASGSPDLVSTLAKIVPSLTAQGYGQDTANATLQMKLRGLSPNDVLVLVDGKRRHTTSNIALDPGPFQGAAGVDLNFIPVDAIDHIEVLTEGAAAQYGSDAIAGVINIILKKDSSGGDLSASYGRYIDGGGATDDVGGHIAFEPIEGSYLNFTAEVRNHGYSDRGGIDGRTLNPDLGPINSTIVQLPDYPYLNHVWGDGLYNLKIATFNSGFKFSGGTEFYLSGTYGDKYSSSFENYRTPSAATYTNSSGATVAPFPYGFNPREVFDETDYELTTGIKGEVADWAWDLSTTYGVDHVIEHTDDSANPSILAGGTYPNLATGGTITFTPGNTPTDFYDGFFKAAQWTTNLDVNRNFDVGLAGPLNVAAGAEYRRNAYTLGAGELSSWVGGGPAAQPGLSPSDAGTNSRTNESGYVDLATKPIDGLRVDVAGRFEHYSDFGSEPVGKFTARYDFTPEVAVRGTISTGFRAPTLAEEYFTSTNVFPGGASVQLQPNSKSSADLGVGNLKPEKSTNYSLGIVFQPTPGLLASLDVYQINIRDRIVSSGTLNSTLNGLDVGSLAITKAINDSGNTIGPGLSDSVILFTNGVNTRTRGADFVLDAPVDYGFGKIDWSIGATYNDTAITSLERTTPELASLAPFATGSTLFDQTSTSDLTTASPKYVINLGALLTVEKLTVNLREIIYGTSSEYQSNARVVSATNPLTYFNDVIGVTPITDLDVAYQFDKHVKLSAGAINLFDRYPNKTNATLLGQWAAGYDRSTVQQYPQISPFGFNGGYYYVRANYSF